MFRSPSDHIPCPGGCGVAIAIGGCADSLYPDIIDRLLSPADDPGGCCQLEVALRNMLDLLMRSQGRMELGMFAGLAAHAPRAKLFSDALRPACVIIRGCTNVTSGRHRAGTSPHSLEAKIPFSTA